MHYYNIMMSQRANVSSSYSAWIFRVLPSCHSIRPACLRPWPVVLVQWSAPCEVAMGKVCKAIPVCGPGSVSGCRTESRDSC